MAILVEIAASRAVIWKDTDGVVWKTTADVVWKSQDDSSTLYLSLDGEALTHYWDAFIASFSSPQYQTATRYGGMVELGFGQITMSPEAFEGSWPPPKTLTVSIKYTATTEEAAVTVFEGDIYLVSYDIESVTYNINAPAYTQRLLDEGPDYDGVTVPYPRAFGTVTHVQPKRLADSGALSYPTYHLGGIGTANDSRYIQSFTSSSAGTKTKVIVETAHGWSNGTSVTIGGSVNFNGTHTIESASGSEFVIPVAFPTDNSEKLPLAAAAFTTGGFVVYDGGIPLEIGDDVIVNGDGSFSLTVTPSSTVTISGTAANTDLDGVAEWVQGRLGLGTLDTTYSRSSDSSSPEVSCWLESQMPVVDFLSDICSFFTHYFYIKSDILYIGDMLLDAGSETRDEFEYFDAAYSAHDAIRQVKAEWTTHEADHLNVDNNFSSATSYVKDISNRVVASHYIRSSGTADGTGTRQLIDSGASFLDEGVTVGDIAYNITDNTSSTVVAVSAAIIETYDDIFVSGEEYEIGPGFPYGQELDVTPYHDTKSNVTTALQNILSVLTKDVVEIRIPMTATLPDPGKKIEFTDSQMVVDVSSWLRARNLTYDFENEEIIIRGEGEIT
jgi:hypothetical protein